LTAVTLDGGAQAAGHRRHLMNNDVIPNFETGVSRPVTMPGIITTRLPLSLSRL
jgi:hypothetical protein